jgi:hypothetical protein
MFAAKPFVQSMTRDQVQAELAEAVRTGNILGLDESGLKLNQINPGRYPVQSSAQPRTRDLVKAELAEAIRTGDLMAEGESGVKLNQINPSRYKSIN